MCWNAAYWEIKGEPSCVPVLPLQTKCLAAFIAASLPPHQLNKKQKPTTKKGVGNFRCHSAAMWMAHTWGSVHTTWFSWELGSLWWTVDNSCNLLVNNTVSLHNVQFSYSMSLDPIWHPAPHKTTSHTYSEQYKFFLLLSLDLSSSPCKCV